MSDDIALTFPQIEELIQRGETVEAQRRIQAVSRSDLKRELRFPLARLARLAYWPEKVIFLLGRIVRPGPKSRVTATQEEKLEYAYALGQLGGYYEACQMLLKLDRVRVPQAMLFTAILRVRFSDFNGAEKLLRDFIAIPGVEAQDRFDALGYLGSVLIHGKQDYEGAKTLFSNLLETEAGHAHLKRNRLDNLLLLVQNEFLMGDASAGLRYMQRLYAEMPSDKMSAPVRWACREWEVLLGLKRGRRKPVREKAALAELDGVLEERRAVKRWIPAMYGELYRAIHLGDTDSLLRLYFGSRYPFFRKRVLRELNAEPSDLASEYRIRVGAKNEFELATLDGSNTVNRARLKEGQLPQRILQILGSDAFVPFQIVELHALLFPQEYFNSMTGPARVHQAIARLRLWLSKRRIPLEIRESDGYYDLTSEKGCTLIVPRPDGAMRVAGLRPRELMLMDRLRTRFGEQSFRAAEGAKLLGVCTKTVTRLLNAAIKTRSARSDGKGRATLYRLGR
ncbi:MAG: hypothetical protein HY074_16190 [Deltaproteobacteria bacterium]|nr:hypothetical protein [Deltaproteobacteria bacterium]